MRVSAGAIASAVAILAACKHPPPASSVAAPDASTEGTLLVTDGGPLPPRCAFVEGANATLRDLGDRRGLAVGEGSAGKDGMAIGIVHTPAEGAEAIVARVASAHVGVEEWTVAKGSELVPDAPPPKAFVVDGSLYAALVARSPGADGGSSSRRIVLRKKGTEAPVASYPEQSVESLAFDAAASANGSRAAIVWDADGDVERDRGGITLGAASLTGSAPAAPARVVSGGTADPDSPRVVAREVGGGWWVAWIAHRPEAPLDGPARAASGDAAVRTAAASALESPAEVPLFSWIEVVAIGDDGASVGAPKRVTAATGHVASFDLAPRANGSLDVVVRDETQAREGEGGKILRVVVSPGEAADEVSVIVAAGVGRGSVDLVAGPSGDPWLAFSDLQDRTLLIPPARAYAGTATAEPLLEGGRLIALFPAESEVSAPRFLAAFPGAEGPLFRELTCSR